jgi:hypothetical protein
MVGLLQGVAFSHNILVFCNSLDLAQGEPAMVAVVANQCSRLMAYCSSPLYHELPELGIIKAVDWTPEPGEWDNSRSAKLQRIKKWCNSAEDLKLLL